ncbi:PIG-L family deacetylase, partial [bacterium]
MARKKAGWKVRVARTGGALVLIMALVWWWIPWEYDLFPKAPPNPNERVDPDTKRLFAKGTRILVVTAHPDDAEFYLGGTLPQLKASGAELSLVVCTDGDKSYYGPFTDVAYNRRVRREEQTAAAKRWGATDIVYLGFPDGRLTDSDDELAGVGFHQGLLLIPGLRDIEGMVGGAGAEVNQPIGL